MSYPILFARNLFLPEDLGGNRYPYETTRRLGERGIARAGQGHRIARRTLATHGNSSAE